jgi:GTP cyclohydrolase I
LLQAIARRPQLQERLGQQLARQLQNQLSARGVVVRLTARQLCMEMRGARSTGSVETWTTLGSHTEELISLVRG